MHARRSSKARSAVWRHLPSFKHHPSNNNLMINVSSDDDDEDEDDGNNNNNSLLTPKFVPLSSSSLAPTPLSSVAIKKNAPPAHLFSKWNDNILNDNVASSNNNIVIPTLAVPSSSASTTTLFSKSLNTIEAQHRRLISPAGRYQREFQVISSLGFGGQGSVSHVKSLIDNHEYAIKCIGVRNIRDIPIFLREVQLMASMTPHPNVVRYYTSWLEESDDECVSSTSSSSEEDDNETHRINLFIQMEYCGDSSSSSTTLESYLEKKSNLKDRMQMFSQIAAGLSHIHKFEIIHRDLKASNIFLIGNDNNIVPKIGDFGLSTNIGTKPASLNTNSSNEHTGKLGTYLYASSEQLSTTSNTTTSIYNQSSDIYSLGIILLELMQPEPFTTLSERAIVLSAARHGDISDKINQAALIKRMTSANPTERPSASDITNDITLDSIDPNECQIASLKTCSIDY